MENLLEETLNALKLCNKTVHDIRWIGCSDFEIDKEDFFSLADKEYDDGYGAAEVAGDLVIVGDYWWLERAEYDGAEWWEYKEKPKRPTEKKKVSRVIGDLWEKLGEMV